MLKLYVQTIALLMVFGVAVASPPENAHRATLKIDTGIGTCSATMVGPHTLLTADHCVSNDGLRKLDIGGQAVDVLSVVSDGKDHVLIRLDTTFKTWVLVRRAPMRQGDGVHLFGNPGDLLDVYRRGYFSGWDELELTEPDNPMKPWPQRGMLFDVPVGAGDSGSGVFDDRGLLVTALSGTYSDRLTLMFALPLAFTEAQWKEARK